MPIMLYRRMYSMMLYPMVDGCLPYSGTGNDPSNHQSSELGTHELNDAANDMKESCKIKELFATHSICYKARYLKKVVQRSLIPWAWK